VLFLECPCAGTCASAEWLGTELVNWVGLLPEVGDGARQFERPIDTLFWCNLDWGTHGVAWAVKAFPALALG
jgi:hypothetical protein